MTATTLDMAAREHSVDAPSRGPGLWHRLVRQRSVALGAVVVGLFTLIAILAPVLAPYGTTEQVGAPFSAPSPPHPLGLDDGGIDMLSLVMHGAQTSLLVGFGATAIAAVIGGIVGILAGYFGGWVDLVLMRIVDYVLIVPLVPVMIVIGAVWGSDRLQILIIIGLFLWVTTARIVRAQIKSLRERTSIRRVRSIGASDSRIIVRHVLPHAVPVLVAAAVPTLGQAVFFEAALSFLGLGDPNAVSWGKLIQNAYQRSAVTIGAWWMIVPPGICIALIVIGSSLIGRGLGDALHPRLTRATVLPSRLTRRPVTEQEQ